MSNIFVSGISTDVGKTVISAILTEAFEADYWKPVQSGTIESSDTLTVKSLISNPKSTFHSETYRLKEPLSPHAAAELENIEIEIDKIIPPKTDNNLITEGAGGLLVPINQEYTIFDLQKKWKIPTVLVSRHYLGSINHTLLSVELLKQYNIPLLGIIFNGAENKATEQIITKMSGTKIIGRIDEAEEVNKEMVKMNANIIKQSNLF